MLLYTRLSLISCLFLINCQIFLVAFTSVGYYQLRTSGFFVHQWDIRLRDFLIILRVRLRSTNTSLGNVKLVTESIQGYLIGNCFQILGAMFLKVAIVLEFIQIFGSAGQRKAFFWCCQVVIWVTILFHSLVIILVNVQCTPHQRIYNLFIPGKCFNKKGLDITAAFVTFTTDTTILLLPHLVIWRLQLPTAKKIGVSAIFAIGVLAVISAICRIPVAIRFYESTDVTYDYSAVAFWALAELTCGIIILSAPSTPKFITLFRPAQDPKTSYNYATSTKAQERSKRKTISQRWASRPDSHAGLTSEVDSGHYEMFEGSNTVPIEGTQRSPNTRKSRIVRTTDFTATEEYDPGQLEEGHRRQHPWIGLPSTHDKHSEQPREG